MVGNFGGAEVLSFHATKFFNTFEGGAIVTNDDRIAETARLMRNFGFAGVDNVIHPGTNGKMTEVCAAMGLANLESIGQFIETNARNDAAYRREFADIPGVTIFEHSGRGKRNLQYVVALVDEDCAVRRDDLVEALRTENVLARKYFWPGVHRMEPYRSLFPHARLVLPQSERGAEQVMVLPTGTAVGDEDIRTIAAIVRDRVAAG